MKGKANIRVFCTFFHPNTNVTAVGGAEKRFLETSRFFIEKGLKLVVFESNPSLLKGRYVSCKVYTLHSPLYAVEGWLKIYLDWILWMLLACFRSVALIQKEKCNLILASNNTVPNLLLAYFAHLVCHLPFCAVAHHIDVLSTETSLNFSKTYSTYKKIGYSPLVSFFKTLAFFIIIRLLKKSDACIAVSDFTAQMLLRSGVASTKVFVSGNGVNLESINYSKALDEKFYDAVFVGRIAKEKGVFDLLKTWCEVIKKRGSARLLIIGSGPDLKEAEEIVTSFGLQGSVIIRGRVDDAEMYFLMKCSRVFVFPSRFEGWGLAVAEALACGLPVVCYDIPALREVFGKCNSVFLVPLGDVKRLSATILRILEIEKEEYDELVKISKNYACRFAWSDVALKDLNHIYKMLASYNRRL